MRNIELPPVDNDTSESSGTLASNGLQATNGTSAFNGTSEFNGKQASNGTLAHNSSSTSDGKQAPNGTSTTDGKKNRPSLVASTICYVLCFALIFSGTGYAFFSSETVSESENRVLARQPELTVDSWFSGIFSSKFTDFLSDHIFERPTLVTIGKSLIKLLASPLDIQVMTRDSDVGVGGSQDPNAITQKDDFMILNDRVLQLFNFSRSSVDLYIENANKLYATIPNRVNTYLMILPGHIAFEPNYKQYSDDQSAAIQYVYDRINSRVTTVDAFSVLAAQNVERTYFRTDHHWTSLGAYYGSSAFFEAAGREYIPLSQYTRNQGDSFLGYLYASFQSTTLASVPDELVYYTYRNTICNEQVYNYNEAGRLVPSSMPVIDPGRQGYYTFVAPYYAYSVIDGYQDDDSVLLVVGDSFMGALAPYLAYNYSKVIVVDPRFYQEGNRGLNNLIRNENVTDFMIVMSTNTMNNTYFTSFITELL